MSNGAPIRAETIEASDDAEAARIASAMSDGKVVELWNAHQRLCVLRPDRLGAAGKPAFIAQPSPSACPEPREIAQ